MSKEVILDVNVTKELIEIWLDSKHIIQMPNIPRNIQKMKIDLDPNLKEND